MDGNDDDIPVFRAGKRQLNSKFLSELDAITTPDKESGVGATKRQKFGLNHRSTTIPKPYIPYTVEMHKAKSKCDVHRRKERAWDNNPSIDLGASPEKRSFSTTSKMLVKPRLPVEATGKGESNTPRGTAPARIIPGQSFMKESVYSKKIATPLAAFANKQTQRLRVLSPPTSSLEKVSAGCHKVNPQERTPQKVDTNPSWRTKLPSKQGLSKIYERKNRPALSWHKTDPMDQRLVRLPQEDTRLKLLPQIKPFQARKPTGTADTPIDLSSDEECDMEILPPPQVQLSSDNGEAILAKPTLRCYQIYVGGTPSTGDNIVVTSENHHLKWLSTTLPIKNIAQIQCFIQATNQIPSCIVLKLTKLNKLKPAYEPFVILMADDAQDVKSFFYAFQRKFPNVKSSEISTTREITTILNGLPGYNNIKQTSPVDEDTSIVESTCAKSKEKSTTRQTRRHRQPSVASKIILHYPLPPATNDVITITMDDLARLSPGQYLNDNLIDYYFKWLQSDVCAHTKSYCLFMGALFFPALRKGFDRVSTWFTFDDVFSKELVVVPINMNLHWSLAIIFNPIQASFPAAQRKSPTTIAFLDSLGKFHKRRVIFRALTQYLGELYSSQGDGCYDLSSIAPLPFVQCPQQHNLYDCGVYMLLSAQTVVTGYASCREQLKEMDMTADVTDEMIEDQLSLQLSSLISSNSFDQTTVDGVRIKMRENIESDAIVYQQMKATDPTLVEYEECPSSEESEIEETMKIHDNSQFVSSSTSPDCDMDMSTESIAPSLTPPRDTAAVNPVVIEDDGDKTEEQVINLDNPPTWSS